MDDDDSPTAADEGRFIPETELQEWFDGMKQKYPQIYLPDETLYGIFDSSHTMGQKLMTYFDEDPTKPMKCEIRGLKWTPDISMYKNKCPMYVVRMGGELSYIPFTSAHEATGWWRGWDTSPPEGWYD